MSSNVFKNIVLGAASAGLAVKRPETPSPFAMERMDISDRFRPVQSYADTSSFYSGASTAGENGDRYYTGGLNVSPMSQSVANQFGSMPRALGAAVGVTGLSLFSTLGSGVSRFNLERIEKNIAEGKEGYALGMLNGRIVGVSPGLFGGYTLSGVLPEGLTPQQRSQLIENILSTNRPSGVQQTPDYAGTAAEAVDLQMAAPQPTDSEQAASYRQNVVRDLQGRPVTIGSSDQYVTTQQGQNVSQAALEQQYQAAQREKERQAALERQRESDNNSSSSSAGSGRTESAGADWSAPSGGSSNPADRGYSMRAEGGRVGMADGGSADPVQGNGFVGGSPDNYTKAQTVADDENRQVREGSFVLNAPTAEKLQNAGLLPKGVDNSDKNSTIKANKGGLMDVALSKGEYVIEPEEAQRIGYSFLEQLNNGGKAEVDRRQAAADGGFIRGYAEGGELPLAKVELSDSTRNKFNTFLKSRRQRADVERLIDNMDDRERLAVLALAETTAATDSVESMMGVGQTAINRARTNRPSFSKVNDLASVMKQRSSRGSGSKMFQYDGLEPGILSMRLKEVVEGRVPGAVTKTFSAADNLLNPETESDPILPFDVMFYTKPNAPLAKNFEKNPKMRFVKSYGGHDYYALDAAPEGTRK